MGAGLSENASSLGELTEGRSEQGKGIPERMHTAKKSLWTEWSTGTEAIGRSLLDCIGNTPLLRLERLGRNYPNVEFYGKAEWLNPGGSVKDRPALEMIRDAERSGRLQAGTDDPRRDQRQYRDRLRHDRCGAGYRVKLCLPASASEERKKILAAYGAELVITPGDEGSDGAILRAREIIAAEPDKYFYTDQYSNPANWRAHYKTTANEIWEQTGGRRNALRGGTRHQRNIRGHNAAPEGIESRDPLHQPPAGRGISRTRRLEAYAVGDRARNLRCDAGRCQPHGQDGRRISLGQACRERRRAPPEPERCRGSRWLFSGCRIA